MNNNQQSMIYLEKPENFNSKFEIVSCFFEHDGKFLILHRQDAKPQGNTWGVPAGKVESGENALEAMIRELKEETGYIALENPVFSHTVYVRYPEYDFIYHIYGVVLDSSHDVKIDSEAHKSFVWVTPLESLEKDLISGMRECIELYYKI